MWHEVRRRYSIFHLGISLAAVFCSPGYGAEEFPVTDIVFDKLERLNSSKLLVTIGLAVGEVYTQKELLATIERGIERLYRTNKFEDVGPLDKCIIEDYAGNIGIGNLYRHEKSDFYFHGSRH